MSEDWQSYVRRIEELAARSGLSFHPVDFEAVPDSFMMEIAVYGLPVRMPHWSFGVRYIYQLIQRHMGNSRLFEVVFPGNPGHAYLAASNGLAENVLVTAHVLGHADFSKNNMLFQRCQGQVMFSCRTAWPVSPLPTASPCLPVPDMRPAARYAMRDSPVSATLGPVNRGAAFGSPLRSLF